VEVEAVGYFFFLSFSASSNSALQYLLFFAHSSLMGFTSFRQMSISWSVGITISTPCLINTARASASSLSMTSLRYFFSNSLPVSSMIFCMSGGSLFQELRLAAVWPQVVGQ